ncbi:hypothetical protein TNCV_1825951 [Trichonephila clavipes]|nr:hypothetical protein TNCV_1825951 [Trichonephila clavipes]
MTRQVLMKLLICFERFLRILLDSGELSCSNLDSDEGIRLSESDFEKLEERADVIDNSPVILDIFVARDGTEWPYHIIVMFLAGLRQSSGPKSFPKRKVSISFL